MLHGNKFLPIEPGKRVILIANTASLPDVSLIPGGLSDNDIIIEFNKAPHHEQLIAIENEKGVKPLHYLIVRNLGERNWNAPLNGFDNFDFVYFPTRLNGLASFKWFQDYKKETNGSVPTTGYAIYRHIKTYYENDILLMGFNPLGDTSTHHSSLHAWAYENSQYNKDNAAIIR